MNGLIRHDEIPEHTELFEIKEFAGYIKLGFYNEYDGSGYLSDGKVVWNIPVNFGQLAKGIMPQNISAYPAEFTHVAWFAA
jgi:hypothetical protein